MNSARMDAALRFLPNERRIYVLDELAWLELWCDLRGLSFPVDEQPSVPGPFDRMTWRGSPVVTEAEFAELVVVL